MNYNELLSKWNDYKKNTTGIFASKVSTQNEEEENNKLEVIPEEIEKSPDETPKEKDKTIDVLKGFIEDSLNTSKEETSDFKTNLTASYKKLGLGDDVIKTLIAKNILETGWDGSHVVGDYNYGNITAGPNWQGLTKSATDNHNGKQYTFRSYQSVDDFVKDEWNLLKNVYGVSENDSFSTIMSKLSGNNPGRRRYAEVSDYSNRVYSVYKQLS